MVTLPLSDRKRWNFTVPSREELRDMWQDRPVAITAMVLAFLLVAGLVTAVIVLALNGKDSTVINTLVAALAVAAGHMLGSRGRGKPNGNGD